MAEEYSSAAASQIFTMIGDEKLAININDIVIIAMIDFFIVLFSKVSCFKNYEKLFMLY
jgi:hypothetical protein